jgi:hypothetical protein
MGELINFHERLEELRKERENVSPEVSLVLREKTLRRIVYMLLAAARHADVIQKDIFFSEVGLKPEDFQKIQSLCLEIHDNFLNGAQPSSDHPLAPKDLIPPEDEPS